MVRYSNLKKRTQRARPAKEGTVVYQASFDHEVDVEGTFIANMIVPHLTELTRVPLVTENGDPVALSVVSYDPVGAPDCLRISFPITAEQANSDVPHKLRVGRGNEPVRHIEPALKDLFFRAGNEILAFPQDFVSRDLSIDVNHQETRHVGKFANGVRVVCFEHKYAGFNGAVFDFAYMNADVEGGRVSYSSWEFGALNYDKVSLFDRATLGNRQTVMQHGSGFFRRVAVYADPLHRNLAKHYLNFDNFARSVGSLSMSNIACGYNTRVPYPDFSTLQYDGEFGYAAVQRKCENRSSGMRIAMENGEKANGMGDRCGPFHPIAGKSGGGTGGTGIEYTPFPYQCPAGHRWAYLSMVNASERSPETFVIGEDALPHTGEVTWNFDPEEGDEVEWEETIKSYRAFDRSHGSRATAGARGLIWGTGIGIAQEVCAHQANRYIREDWDLTEAIEKAALNPHQGDVRFHRDKAWLMDSVATVYRTRYLLSQQHKERYIDWAQHMAQYFDLTAMDNGCTHRAHETNSHLVPSPWEMGKVSLVHDVGQSYQVGLVSHGALALYRAVLEGVAVQAGERVLDVVSRACASLMNQHPGHRPGDWYVTARHGTRETYDPPLWLEGLQSEDGWLASVLATMWFLTGDARYFDWMEVYGSIDPQTAVQTVSGWSMPETHWATFMAATQHAV